MEDLTDDDFDYTGYGNADLSETRDLSELANQLRVPLSNFGGESRGYIADNDDLIEDGDEDTHDWYRKLLKLQDIVVESNSSPISTATFCEKVLPFYIDTISKTIDSVQYEIGETEDFFHHQATWELIWLLYHDGNGIAAAQTSEMPANLITEYHSNLTDIFRVLIKSHPHLTHISRVIYWLELVSLYSQNDLDDNMIEYKACASQKVEDRDFDYANREAKPIPDPNVESLMRVIWRLLRQGRLEEAKELCCATNQSHRAGILDPSSPLFNYGQDISRQFHHSRNNIDESNMDTSMNEQRIPFFNSLPPKMFKGFDSALQTSMSVDLFFLQQEACAALSEHCSNSGRVYEAAVASVLAGTAKHALPIAGRVSRENGTVDDTWEDQLWILLREYLCTRLALSLDWSGGTHGHETSLPQPLHALASIFQSVSTRPYYSSHPHLLSYEVRALLVCGNIPLLLANLNRLPSTGPEMTFFYAHLCILFKTISNVYGISLPADIDDPIQNYVNVLQAGTAWPFLIFRLEGNKRREMQLRLCPAYIALMGDHSNSPQNSAQQKASSEKVSRQLALFLTDYVSKTTGGFQRELMERVQRMAPADLLARSTDTAAAWLTKPEERNSSMNAGAMIRVLHLLAANQQWDRLFIHGNHVLATLAAQREDRGVEQVVNFLLQQRENFAYNPENIEQKKFCIWIEWAKILGPSGAIAAFTSFPQNGSDQKLELGMHAVECIGHFLGQRALWRSFNDNLMNASLRPGVLRVVREHTALTAALLRAFPARRRFLAAKMLEIATMIADRQGEVHEDISVPERREILAHLSAVATDAQII